MQPLRAHTGRAVPLRRSDVDTDQIIPSEWLKRVERTGFGAGLFAQWRSEPGFVLDDPVYAGASVLVAGRNFGTGSSREHAVWALEDFGFRAVVSPSLADIFRTNCTKVGVVPVEVDEDIVTRLWDAVEADPTTLVTVDVEHRRLRCPSADVDVEFPLDDFTRWRLVEGLDDIGLTLRHISDITTYEQSRPGWRPTTLRRVGDTEDDDSEADADADDADAALFADLSRRLRDAHRTVGGLVLPEEEKAAVVRRLIAVTDAAKHDLRRASERLDLLLQDLPPT